MSLAGLARAAGDADRAQVKNNLLGYLTGADADRNDPAVAEALQGTASSTRRTLASLRADGSWADINYAAGPDQEARAVPAPGPHRHHGAGLPHARAGALPGSRARARHREGARLHPSSGGRGLREAGQLVVLADRHAQHAGANAPAHGGAPQPEHGCGGRGDHEVPAHGGRARCAATRARPATGTARCCP